MFPDWRSLLLAGLAIAMAQPDRVSIVDAAREYAASDARHDAGRRFDPSRTCSVKKSAATIREILGPDLKAIRVDRYDKAQWSNMTAVSEYLQRIVAGQPEGRELLPYIHWAEGRRVEIEGVAEFAGGGTTRVEFANGYAHVQDASGCEWWGRYLGGDRNTWIVRE
jgi:hypothetical protein